MAVPASMPEQIEAALQARWESIVADGTNYNRSVDACLRVPIFHGGCLDPKKNCVYTISPDTPTEEETELGSNKLVISRLRLVAVLAGRFLPKDEKPFSAELPLRVTVQTQLERDAKKKLGEDYTLGIARVINTEIVTVDRSMEFTYIEGWATVRMQLVSTFEYQRTAP